MLPTIKPFACLRKFNWSISFNFIQFHSILFNFILFHSILSSSIHFHSFHPIQFIFILFNFILLNLTYHNLSNSINQLYSQFFPVISTHFHHYYTLQNDDLTSRFKEYLTFIIHLFVNFIDFRSLQSKTSKMMNFIL